VSDPLHIDPDRRDYPDALERLAVLSAELVSKNPTWPAAGLVIRKYDVIGFFSFR
jgi:hypothetical protein